MKENAILFDNLGKVCILSGLGGRMKTKKTAKKSTSKKPAKTLASLSKMTKKSYGKKKAC